MSSETSESRRLPFIIFEDNSKFNNADYHINAIYFHDTVRNLDKCTWMTGYTRTGCIYNAYYIGERLS
jgi:hypothetical protein